VAVATTLLEQNAEGRGQPAPLPCSTAPLTGGVFDPAIVPHP
jgi:hypothetical protein